MKYYFYVQWQIIQRQLRAFGVAPWLGISVAGLAFVVLSYLLFQKSGLAVYLYMGFAVFFSKSKDYREKLDFLRLQYGIKQMRQILNIEHSLIALPFLLVILISGNFLQVAICMLLVYLVSWVPFEMKSRLRIPNPYQQFPFEFAIGFRKYFLLVVMAYTIGIIACVVANFNIAIFGMLILALTMMNYYSLVEPSFIIWEDVRSERTLLHYKLKVGLRYFILTSIPLWTMIVIVYPTHWMYVLLWAVILLIYFLVFILMKYDAFPRAMGLPHTIYFIACMIIPPLLIVFAYRFYKRSLNHLKMYIR